MHGVDDFELPGGSNGNSTFEFEFEFFKGGSWSRGVVQEFKLWEGQWIATEKQLGDGFQGSYIFQVPA